MISRSCYSESFDHVVLDGDRFNLVALSESKIFNKIFDGFLFDVIIKEAF